MVLQPSLTPQFHRAGETDDLVHGAGPARKDRPVRMSRRTRRLVVLAGLGRLGACVLLTSPAWRSSGRLHLSGPTARPAATGGAIGIAPPVPRRPCPRACRERAAGRRAARKRLKAKRYPVKRRKRRKPSSPRPKKGAAAPRPPPAVANRARNRRRTRRSSASKVDGGRRRTSGARWALGVRPA